MKRFVCISNVIFFALLASLPIADATQGANSVETKNPSGELTVWNSPAVPTLVTIELIGCGGAGGIFTPLSFPNQPTGTFQSGGGGGGGAYVKATMMLPANTRTLLCSGRGQVGTYPATAADTSVWFSISGKKPTIAKEGVVCPGGECGVQNFNPVLGGIGGLGGVAANAIGNIVAGSGRNGGNGGNGGAGNLPTNLMGTGGGGGGGATANGNGGNGGNGGPWSVALTGGGGGASGGGLGGFLGGYGGNGYPSFASPGDGGVKWGGGGGGNGVGAPGWVKVSW